MSPNVLSKNVIRRVFGSDFGHPDSSGVRITLSSQKATSDSSTHPGGGIEVTPQSNQDGVKPSKSPRTSPPTEDTVASIDNKSLDISQDEFGKFIRAQLDAAVQERKDLPKQEKPEGRLGPDIVKYDVGSHVGSFVISSDRLGVNSQCNFGSVKASTCVYKGKWQYEVQLGSKGVMQLGWATLETRFSQEKGVGDTSDSYAYDGNRLRKWNKTTSPYGETWQAGDIIGCCIDLDEGKMEFLRNGKSMGVAFNNIRRGPGMAYFPAASLAYGENIVTNFGATPFQCLVEGYSPLQIQSNLNNARADLLLQWLNNLLSLYPENQFHPSSAYGGIQSTEYQTLLVITNRLVEFLGPHLQSGYVVEQSFFPFFAKCIGLPEKVTHNDTISSQNISHKKTDLLLDIMWTFLEEQEMKSCLEKLAIILMNQFRSNSLSLAYPYQRYSLECLLALINHRTTRRHMIRHLIFDKAKLMHFLHIRPVDETVLKEVIPETWWPGKSGEDSRQAYENSCLNIQNRISDVQTLQTKLLKTLLTNTDGTEKRPSSRALFLRKFRLFIRDVVRPGSVLHQPVDKAMATFFCFLRTIAELYSEEVEQNDKNCLPGIPPTMFYDTSVLYYEIERVGGLSSYLYKAHHREVSESLSIPDYLPVNSTQAEASHAHRVNDLIHQDTPFPSRGHLTRDMATIFNPNEGGTPGALISPPITVSVPNNQSIPNSENPEESGVGILSTMGPESITTQTQTSQVSARNAINLMPPPPPPRTINIHMAVERDENAENVNISATSSGEVISPPLPVPRLGAALLAGTPSGHNMLIPMLTDFRNLIAQGEHGLSYFTGGMFGMDNRNSVTPHNPAVALLGKDCGTMDVRASLRELLDDVIIIYSCGVKRHIEKVVGLRNTMEDYVKALNRANDALQSDSLLEDERAEIQKSADIFSSKLEDQSRHIAWVKSAVFTKERQLNIYELLKTILATLKSSSTEGPLFTFVPEHYISSLISLSWCLLTQMHPTVSFQSLPGHEVVLAEVAEFVATHFADSRIIIAETKDILTQALSSFICNRTMLTALEAMPEESQVSMVKSILRPYENRAWAQSNWMLVRFWQGSGYGFQYPNTSEARRSFRAKPVQDEFGISTNLPPTPSPILQSHVAHVLIEDQGFAVKYVNSVLNQLNWAFSEFVGLLQEIQNAAQRPERVFIESRQLKICCTCFELTQALLRVMEMLSSTSAAIMMDSSRDSSETLLSRLCMLMCQILNRIGSNTGSFAQVIELDIPGLENVTYYPLLSAVAGILIALIGNEVDKTEASDVVATKALLAEPSFQLDSLNFFFGRDQLNVPEGRRIFTLSNHVPNDMSEEEIQRLERTIAHIQLWSQRLIEEAEEVDDENICTICYAYQKNTTFKPCNHRSCKACILHHLMNRGECFFCKSTIAQVFTDDQAKIYDIATSKRNDDSNPRRVML